MKDILFLTTQFPYPLDNGGKIGAFNGLNVISKNNNVTVLSFSEEVSYYKEGVEFFKNILPNVTFIKPIQHDVHIRKKPLKLAKAIFRGCIKDIPYAVSKFHNTTMYKNIDILMRDKHWDLIFIDYINMCGYGEYIRTCYRKSYDYFIFKNHNKEHELVQQEAKKYSGMKKKILVADASRTLKCEIREVQRADIVYSVCNDNTEFFKLYNNNSYSMLPTYNPDECEEQSFSPNKKILYIGGLSWNANLNGLVWFVEKVFPIVKSSIHEATLTIIGGGLPNNPFEGKDGVEYLGYVKDISDVYFDKNVFIVPLFEGSGIRIKILEAFDKQVPVVSTSVGCDTIGANNTEQILVANTIDEFADAVISLLSDEKLNMKIRKNAKKYLLEKFSLERRQVEFEDDLKRLYSDSKSCDCSSEL